MTGPGSERGQVLEQQRATWDSVSDRWYQWQETFERGGAVVTSRLLELAGVRPGQRVLDLGTGIGEPALSAARVVGPAGRVLGVDLAGSMIDIARRRGAGLAQLDFRVGDIDALDLPEQSFDAVLSRLCLMFVPDRVDALRTLRRLLVPGGRLAAAVWAAPERAPMVGLPFRVIGPLLDLPPPPAGQPGPYAMADPQQCAADLAAAGFDEGSVAEVEAPFWLESPQRYAEFARAVLPQAVRDRLGPADNPALWEEVAELAAGYQAADGAVRLDSATLCFSGVARP